MKKRLFLLLPCLLLLCACAKGGNEEYLQKELKAPEYIRIQSDTSTTDYTPDTAEYQKLYTALQPNWWKTAVSTLDAVKDEDLFMAEAPGQLKTILDRTYRESGDTFVCFCYDSAPISWVEPRKTTSIQMIAFLLPPAQESTEHTKGAFTISQNGTIGSNEGWFTYYYPPQITGGLWDFLEQE